jgi:hypothetical protein
MASGLHEAHDMPASIKSFSGAVSTAKVVQTSKRQTNPLAAVVIVRAFI